jgi:glycosyltransferase involved in cell wall biosynthesis
MSQSVLVSVVIPVYNSGDVFQKTLECVIKQTYYNIEIIIVDDGSETGAIHSIIDKFKDQNIQYFRLPHKNANVARNYGIQVAKGQYIAMLDADDLWFENHIESCLRVLKNEHTDGLYGSLIVENHLGRRIVHARKLKNNETMVDYLLSTVLGAQTSTLFFTAGSAKSVKWDVGLKRHQDYDFVVRYNKQYELSVKTDPTVIYTEKLKLPEIDFRSCIRFIESNKKDINPSLYNNHNFKMLLLAKQYNADDEIISYYIREATFYKEFISYLDFIKIKNPQNKIDLFKYKIEYLFYITRMR